MKIVFATGIAGSGKPAYLREFEKFCAEHKKRCKVVAIGELMFAIADEIGLRIKEEKILNLPASTLKTLISLAFERCAKEYSDEDVVVISTHASYWWKRGPAPAFDISYLGKINPDVYITVINDAIKIRDKIYSDPNWGKGIITLDDIFLWQELEVYTTEILSSLQKKGFYLIHRDYPVQTLFNLVFNEKAVKVYTSYPMFNAGGEIKKADRLVKTLRKHCIVFNPTVIEDLPKMEDKGMQDMANNWTVRRDYKFIDQSDKVIVYFPKIVHSPGVEKEMAYAHNANKEIWLMYPSTRKSPFTTYYTDKLFKNPDEVIAALREINKRRKVKLVL